MMTVEEFRDILKCALELAVEEDYLEEPSYVGTFEEGGYLTMNDGLVVRTEGGQEFQVSIVEA